MVELSLTSVSVLLIFTPTSCLYWFHHIWTSSFLPVWPLSLVHWRPTKHKTSAIISRLFSRGYFSWFGTTEWEHEEEHKPTKIKSNINLQLETSFSSGSIQQQSLASSLILKLGRHKRDIYAHKCGPDPTFCPHLNLIFPFRTVSKAQIQSNQDCFMLSQRKFVLDTKAATHKYTYYTHKPIHLKCKNKPHKASTPFSMSSI